MLDTQNTIDVNDGKGNPIATTFLWADLIRSLAILWVVVIHVADLVVRKWHHIPDTWWHIGNVFGASTRVAVPLFVMLSGALLLGRKESYKEFAQKRLVRILLPLLVWSIIYFLYRMGYHGKEISWQKALTTLLKGKAYFHLWFFYMLAGLYLMTPLLRIFVQHAQKRDLFYLICLWFYVVSLVWVLRFYLDLRIGIDLVNLGGYLGYFVAGYLIVTSRISSRMAWLALAVWMVALLVTVIGTVEVVQEMGKYNERFYNYRSWNVVLMSISCFILLKYTADRWENRLPGLGIKILSVLSQASLGVYLIHVIPLEFFQNGSLGFTLHPAQSHPLWMIPLMVICVFGVSLAVTLILLRIPLVRRWV